MALHSLYCADVPLRNCSLTHSFFLSVLNILFAFILIIKIKQKIDEKTMSQVKIKQCTY